jgi:methionyl-tRNA formyltransferase
VGEKGYQKPIIDMLEQKNITELVNPDDSRKQFEDGIFEWGELSAPAKSEIHWKNTDGLRVLFVGSCTPGLLALESIKRFEQKYKDTMKLVAVVTDSPVDAKAKISLEKRIWRFFTREEREQLYNRMKEETLSFGIPFYSGAIKTVFFHNLLTIWKPELIIMCCYGQKVDAEIFNFPEYGMYNLHPSDLAASIGIGTKPVEHTVSLGYKTSRSTFHTVNELMDGGAIIGESPKINILLPDGTYQQNTLSLYNKVCSVFGWMVIDLIMAVLGKKSQGKSGLIESLDFEKSMPDSVKNILMEPASPKAEEKYIIPLHTALC